MADRRPVADERLETLLKAWGLIYGDAYRDEPRKWKDTAQHPIARSMEFAPGKRSKYKDERQVVGRAGDARRLIMGAAAGLRTSSGKVLPIPADFIDPIRCAASRSSGGGIISRPVPVELQRVELAVQDLEEFKFIRGLCARVQFASDADQKDKTAKVNEIMRRKVSRKFDGISLSAYRDEVLYARVWLHGALRADLNVAGAA